MTKNPLINALSASGYIVLVVGVLNLLSLTQGNKPDTPFAPFIFLSLLTLSVSFMAFVFFYQPLQYLVDGKKREAVKLLAQTIGIFAAITGVGLVLVFTSIL